MVIRTKSPTAKKKAIARAPSSTRLGRVELMLEDISSQIKLLTETMSGRMDSIERKMEENRQELLARIEVIESVVRQNSIAIQKNNEDIRQNSEDIRQNSLDIQRNSEDIRKNSEDIRKNSEDILKNSEDIRQNTADIKRNSADIRQNSEDIARLSVELVDLRGQVQSLIDSDRFSQIEARVTVIEHTVGVQGKHV